MTFSDGLKVFLPARWKEKGQGLQKRNDDVFDF